MHAPKKMLLLPLTLLASALFMGTSTCGKPVESEGCTSDTACNPDGTNYWTCELETGNCLCRNNSACDSATEFCNDRGFCQERAGCFSNQDCVVPNFCDVTTGSCIDPRSGRCSLDTHCPFTYYCNAGTCAPGCQDSGDCPFGYGCIMGSCVEGGCQVRADCGYGQRCSNNYCQPGLDAKTCADCSCPVPGVPCSAYLSCEDGAHTCLINSFYDATDPTTRPENYCVPKCTTDEDCPYGFDCNDIFMVIGTCSRGTTCSNGQACIVYSEATTGYCPCQSDTECIGTAGGCDENGLCFSHRACGLFTNLQCYDVGVVN